MACLIRGGVIVVYFSFLLLSLSHWVMGDGKGRSRLNLIPWEYALSVHLFHYKIPFLPPRSFSCFRVLPDVPPSSHAFLSFPIPLALLQH